jgi:site-specific recombinase XerD
MRLNEVILRFQKYQIALDRSEHTIHAYTNDLHHFGIYLAKAHNCAVYLEDITTEDIEEYLYHLKEEKEYKPASRKRKLAVLRAFYTFCYRKQFCIQNAAAEVEQIKIDHKERSYLTDEEVEKFIVSVEHRLMKLVIQTLYYTGLRISECVGLTLDDVDAAENVFHVKGKGGKGRMIPMHEKLKALLVDYRDNWRPERGTDNFFCTYQSGKLSRNYVNRIIKETRAQLGWKKPICCHSFRHAFSSSLVKRNVNIVKIQKLLGHASLATTSIYTHTSLDELYRAINTL